jgi:predicted lipid-binding transport protein (Tim44 family)
MKVWSVILVCAMALTSHEVWAKRLGGGSSVGKQSSNVTQRNATPVQPAPTQGATQNATQNAAQRPAAAPAAAQPKRPWGAMLGGLAAGLGLAWLASAMGFGEGFAQFLLILLAGVAVLAIIAMIRRSRAAAQPARSPLAFQGAGPVADPVTARSYSPQNVGNDASARPWERGNSTFGQGESAPQGSMIGSALGGPQTWGVPADFDTEGFLRASKGNFLKLQDAWDRGDIPALRAMMTDDMIVQIQAQLAEREAQGSGVVNQTEVVMLEAQLLGIEETEHEYMASVEFSGMIREDASAGPNPFREVWNITRPKAGPGGWLVAGVQALQ